LKNVKKLQENRNKLYIATKQTNNKKHNIAF